MSYQPSDRAFSPFLVASRPSIVVWLLLAGAALPGCRDAWDTGSGWTSSESIPPPRNVVPSFSEQVAAVRAGKSDSLEWAVRLDGVQLQEIAGLSDLRVVVLDAGLPSADRIERLAGLTKLEHLRIRETPIDDTGVGHLVSLRNLRIVNLPHSLVSDAGLRLLASLPALEQLRLGSPNVSDAGMEALAESKTLLRLHLIETPITDAGLIPIQNMRQLQSFYLDGSQVTDTGMSALIRVRPDLHFHKDQRHRDYDPNRHE